MGDLASGLRGFTVNRGTPKKSGLLGTGASLLLHGVGLATFVLTPLLGATQAPDTVNALQAPLVQPITVSLPPAPKTKAQPARRVNRTEAVRATSATPAPPHDVPTAILSPADVLDDAPTGPPGSAGKDTENGTGLPGEACALGALCGNGLAPAPSPSPIAITRVGGLIREPRLIEGRPPRYPPLAQASGVSGAVVVEAHVGPDGRIRDVRVVEGNPLFNDEALASVRSRRYESLLLNGVPTDFLITITVAFRIRRP